MPSAAVQNRQPICPYTASGRASRRISPHAKRKSPRDVGHTPYVTLSAVLSFFTGHRGHSAETPKIRSESGQKVRPALRPVALLILLPAATRTRIVPTSLLPRHHRRRTARIVAAHELQLGHLALLLALDVAREVLHRGFRRLPLCLVGVGSRRFLLALFFLVLLRERQHRTRPRVHLQEEESEEETPR